MGTNSSSDVSVFPEVCGALEEPNPSEAPGVTVECCWVAGETYPSEPYSVTVDVCGVAEEAIPSDAPGIIVDVCRVLWEAYSIESYGVTVEVCGVSYCLISYYLFFIFCCFIDVVLSAQVVLSVLFL